MEWGGSYNDMAGYINLISFFPDLIKEREELYKEINKIIADLEVNQFQIYGTFIEPIDRLIEISLTFEEHEFVNDLTKLKNYTEKASRLAEDLNELDEKIREFLKKI